MAGGQERVLRRRIKSVQSTKKITRAMELIAATRIVKAQQRVLAARPYADQITSVIRSLASGGAGVGQPLLTPKASVKTNLYVVLAGGVLRVDSPRPPRRKRFDRVKRETRARQ